MILICNRLCHYGDRKYYGTDCETERKPDMNLYFKPNYMISPLLVYFLGDASEPSVISLRIYKDEGDRIIPSSLMNPGTIVVSYFIWLIGLDRNLCFDYSLKIHVKIVIIKTSQLQAFPPLAFNFMA